MSNTGNIDNIGDKNIDLNVNKTGDGMCDYNVDINDESNIDKSTN